MTRGDPRETKSPVNSKVVESMQVVWYVMKCSVVMVMVFLERICLVNVMQKNVCEKCMNLVCGWD